MAQDNFNTGNHYHQADDEDVEAKHHEELSLKHRLFLRQQAEKTQAHQQQQAARIYQFHSQHGDGPTHELAKGLFIAHGPDHLKGIGKHLWQSGAQPTAKILLDHAAGAMNQG